MFRFLVLCLLIPASLAGQPAPAQPPASVDEAKRLFDQLRYEDAVPVLTRVLQDLQLRPESDVEARSQRLAAIELRARARFGMGDRTGARDDLRDLLIGQPTFSFAVSVTPRLTALLEEVRKTTVGTMTVTADPPDATLTIDGRPADLVSGASLPLAAGVHQVGAHKPGFRPVQIEVRVEAGTTTPATLTLERVSAVVVVFTDPPGVTVTLDGKPVGATRQGPPPANYRDWLVAAGLDPARVSAPLEVVDVPSGSHEIAYSLPCHVPEVFRIDVPKPADYRLDPMVMKPSVGQVTIEGAAGALWLDGQAHGTAPAVLEGVCSGPHTIDVRSTVGRFRRQVDLKAGDHVTLSATPLPAIALVSTSGRHQAQVSSADVLQAVERLLSGSRSATVFTPSSDELARVARENPVPESWLATTTDGGGQGPDALADAARRETGIRLTQAFDAQAVADVVFSPREGTTGVFLRLLAAGSGRPDEFELQLDNAVASAAALDRNALVLTRRTLGFDVFEVADADGLVLSHVDPAVSSSVRLAPGDVIAGINGHPVATAMSLERALDDTAVGSRVRLDVRERTGANRQVEVPVLQRIRLASVHDRLVRWNKVAIDLRARVVTTRGPVDALAVQANLAVALMRLGSWAEARDLLANLTLPDEGGVGRGTILYLRGVCAEAVSDTPGALAAYRAAAAVPGALLTEDGPLIATLAADAEARLSGSARRLESGTRLPVPGA